MKNMTKIALLLAGLAAGNSAQAQTRIVVPSGQDYTIGNIVSASGDNVTYQWFRNNAVVAGATSATYTIPAISATGNSAVFQRAAYGLDCQGGVAMSNMVTVYFCDLMVNGVCWARGNSTQYGAIYGNPYEWGYYYQWNRPAVAYYRENPEQSFQGTFPSGDTATSWTNGYPCPDGWRLPTERDFRNLIATSQPVGGVWATGGTKGIPSGVNGKFFGYNAANCTISSMAGCIFLPSSGLRWRDGGWLTIENTEARYWASTNYSTIFGYLLQFSNTATSVSSYYKECGITVRCVQDVVQ